MNQKQDNVLSIFFERGTSKSNNLGVGRGLERRGGA